MRREIRQRLASSSGEWLHLSAMREQPGVLRGLRENDEVKGKNMNAVVELRRLAAVERELEALKASIGEPVAWRYKDSRGHYRYCGYKTGFDTEHSLLKPIPLYAIAKDKP